MDLVWTNEPQVNSGLLDLCIDARMTCLVIVRSSLPIEVHILSACLTSCGWPTHEVVGTGRDACPVVYRTRLPIGSFRGKSAKLHILACRVEKTVQYGLESAGIKPEVTGRPIKRPLILLAPTSSTRQADRENGASHSFGASTGSSRLNVFHLFGLVGPHRVRGR